MPPVRKHHARERPGADPAAPGGVDPTLDQGGDGKGEGDGEADIAGVENGRMESEAGVLQQRVHVAAVHRRRPEAGERVAGEQAEQQEARPRCRRARRSRGPGEPRVGRARTPATAPPHTPRIRRPKQNGALVVPPGAGDLVEQRLQRVAVLGDVEDRKVVGRRWPRRGRRRRRPGPSSCADGERGGGGHEPGIAAMGAPQSAGRPGRRRGRRRAPGRNAAEFGDHVRHLHHPPAVLGRLERVPGGGGRRRRPVPDAIVQLLLQRIRDVAGHVGLVVLGQDLLSPGRCRSRCKLPSITAPCPSRNKSGRMPE